jgi:hypothetical protein
MSSSLLRLTGKPALIPPVPGKNQNSDRSLKTSLFNEIGTNSGKLTAKVS